jgi:hypothetical protein
VSGREQYLHERRIEAERPLGILRRPSLADRVWMGLTYGPVGLSRAEGFVLIVALALLAFCLLSLPGLVGLYRDVTAALEEVAR